jgi:hypothetical protein
MWYMQKKAIVDALMKKYCHVWIAVYLKKEVKTPAAHIPKSYVNVFGCETTLSM